jgi:hypothetical protein
MPVDWVDSFLYSRVVRLYPASIIFAEEQLVANIGSASFHHHFQDLQDPRVERTRKHPLINIVFIAVCGVLSGAK